MWSAHLLLLWGKPGAATPATPPAVSGGGGPQPRRRRPQIIYVLDVDPDGKVQQRTTKAKKPKRATRVIVEVNTDVTLPARAPAEVRAAARAAAKDRPAQLFRVQYTIPRLVVRGDDDDEDYALVVALLIAGEL